MRRTKRFTRAQRRTILNGIMTFVVLIVILQVWLFTATVNMYLGGTTSVLGPTAIASLVCLALNMGLLRYLYGLER